MNVVFEDSGYFVLVEVRDPVEEGVKITFWAPIEGLTDGVDRNVIADELELILVVFEGVDHEVLLVPKSLNSYP